MKRKPILFIVFSVLLVASLASACGGTTVPAGLTITDVWARASAMSSDAMDMGGKNSAVYMKINNAGAADKLVQAASAVATSTELHTVEMKDGVMQMRQVEGGIDVPANGAVELKPGGFHVMLIGLHQDLKPGDTFNLKLTFEKAGVQDIPVQVRAMVQ